MIFLGEYFWNSLDGAIYEQFRKVPAVTNYIGVFPYKMYTVEYITFAFQIRDSIVFLENIYQSVFDRRHL